jgi:uncharacterized membrane protein YsdA (DUF1294 family)
VTQSNSQPSNGATRRRFIPKWWANPYYRFTIFGLGVPLLAIILAAVARFSLFGILVVWLVAINLTTVIVFRYDKGIADRGFARVPERILLLFTALGGSVGAYLAMYRFGGRHKTQKRWFQVIFWVIVAVQVLLLIWRLIILF